MKPPIGAVICWGKKLTALSILILPFAEEGEECSMCSPSPDPFSGPTCQRHARCPGPTAISLSERAVMAHAGRKRGIKSGSCYTCSTPYGVPLWLINGRGHFDTHCFRFLGPGNSGTSPTHTPSEKASVVVQIVGWRGHIALPKRCNAIGGNGTERIAGRDHLD